ncbi:MAG: hypothetical protein M1501_04195 [Candidatus Omnitrophica bacterium]|nr:hypothetical protein [Candidatus Omnitrophota bacterium]
MRKFKLLVFIAGVLFISFSFVHADVLTQNLLQNGDFGKAGIPLPGWSINLSPGESYKLTSDVVIGKKALEIDLPVAGNADVISAPSPVSGGASYLLIFWYHANGMSTKGWTYQGCNSYCSIIWQDAGGKEIKNTNAVVGLPYGSVKYYQPATFTTTAPERAVKVIVSFNIGVGKEYKGPPTSIFIDDIRLMKLTKVSIPVKPEKWVYLHRNLSAGLKMVEDKNAEHGQAIMAAPGVTPKYTGLTWGQYTKDQPVGEYLAVFRLKVKNNTKKEPVAQLDVNDFGNLNGEIAEKTLFATDFKHPGVYQDFTLRFVRPEAGVLEFRVMYLGTTSLSFDKTTVIQLKSLKTDKEQFAIWFGKGSVK